MISDRKQGWTTAWLQLWYIILGEANRQLHHVSRQIDMMWWCTRVNKLWRRIKRGTTPSKATIEKNSQVGCKRWENNWFFQEIWCKAPRFLEEWRDCSLSPHPNTTASSTDGGISRNLERPRRRRQQSLRSVYVRCERRLCWELLSCYLRPRVKDQRP